MLLTLYSVIACWAVSQCGVCVWLVMFCFACLSLFVCLPVCLSVRLFVFLSSPILFFVLSVSHFVAEPVHECCDGNKFRELYFCPDHTKHYISKRLDTLRNKLAWTSPQVLLDGHPIRGSPLTPRIIGGNVLKLWTLDESHFRLLGRLRTWESQCRGQGAAKSAALLSTLFLGLPLYIMITHRLQSRNLILLTVRGKAKDESRKEQGALSPINSRRDLRWTWQRFSKQWSSINLISSIYFVTFYHDILCNLAKTDALLAIFGSVLPSAHHDHPMVILDGWAPCMVACHLCGREFGAASSPRTLVVHANLGHHFISTYFVFWPRLQSIFMLNNAWRNGRT